MQYQEALLEAPQETTYGQQFPVLPKAAHLLSNLENPNPFSIFLGAFFFSVRQSFSV